MSWLRGRKAGTGTPAAGVGTRIVLRIEGMHCSSCGLLFDGELEEISGVHSSRTSVREARTTVELTRTRAVDVAELIEGVERAGYRAVHIG